MKWYWRYKTFLILLEIADHLTKGYLTRLLQEANNKMDREKIVREFAEELGQW